MKKLLLFLIFIPTIQFSKAQTPSWIWAESSTGGDWENGIGLSIDTANRLYFDGRAAGTMNMGGGTVTTACGSYSDNPIIGEFDTSGNMKWVQTYEYSCGNDYTEAFYRDNKDNVYSGGIIGSNCCGMFIDKYDSAGNLKWAFPINDGGGNNSCFGIAADNEGYVYITGTMGSGTITLGSVSFSYSGSSQAIFLAQLDSNGNCIWGKTINGTGSADGNDQARDLIVDNKGYVYFSGDYNGQPNFGTITPPATTGNSNYFLAKYDTAGNAIWVNPITDAFDNTFGGTNSIVIDSCGNLYITGTIQGTAMLESTNSTSTTLSLTSAGGQDMFVARCDNNGNWQWAQSAGGANNDNGEAITIDKNSDIYVAGYSQSGGLNFGNGVSTTSGDIFIAKYSNGNGAAQWAQSATANSGVGALAVDKYKYVYAMGSMGSTATFGSTTLYLTSTQNIVLAKLDTVTSRTIIPTLQASYCPGSTDTVSYMVTGTFNSGNTFTVQLSDSTGSFVNATSLGFTTSTTNGTIIITIPDTTPQGSTYLIRIISSNPAASSYFNGCGAYYVQNVYPNDFYVSIGSGGTITPSIFPLDTSICPGASLTLTASGGTSYKWSNGDTGSVIIVLPTTDSLFTVTAKSGCGTGMISDSITVGQAPSFIILPIDTGFCNSQSAILYVSGDGSNFIWTPTDGITDSTLSGDSVTVSPTATTTYMVTGINSSGCATSGTDMVNVIASPGTPTFSQNGNVLTSSSVHDNQWFRNDSILNNDTSENLTIIVSGYYWVVVTNEANGCSTASDSVYIKVSGINQISAISDQLSIYPNPFNNNIFIKINSSAGDIKDWNLQITDVLGQTVFNKLFIDYSNDIDLSNLASGVYFITVINKTGRAVFPIVRQNQ